MVPLNFVVRKWFRTNGSAQLVPHTTSWFSTCFHIILLYSEVTPVTSPRKKELGTCNQQGQASPHEYGTTTTQPTRNMRLPPQNRNTQTSYQQDEPVQYRATEKVGEYLHIVTTQSKPNLQEPTTTTHLHTKLVQDRGVIFYCYYSFTAV